ncbi:glycogen debranching enzyme [Capsaspora owczarzaki ATCC 30864]|uniref:Glycogen debranching enzyme n=1 Tax=Capsaspora owczarzaki (strain ATCC 30864) TaxID=595528 RepID=A0A0D2X4G8_CAPO3|nr:glycogen debranching enzyme [Capsaspora owczarzaki ATCC 30864]KJE96034.1 glycogen debranching enzyme [Capsaspora owczarzaki ATCC 30864]|eukprot:XP_004345155.2 glycogen debranching enzyme [Capsaspora owczarzaki ATCC 30864]
MSFAPELDPSMEPRSDGRIVWVLLLTASKTLAESQHYSLPKGSVLRFARDSTLQGFRVNLYCNYPSAMTESESASSSSTPRTSVSSVGSNELASAASHGQGAAGESAVLPTVVVSEAAAPQAPRLRPFNRDVYTHLEWQTVTTGSAIDSGSRFADLEIDRSGAFQFYVDCEPIDPRDHSPGQRYAGAFVVQPNLLIRGLALQLDAICMQTVLSKCLGRVDDWERRLKPSMEAGYNMIHFTPLQALGGSNSAYSLSDQLRLNPTLFPGLSTEDAWKRLASVVHELEFEHDTLSVSDVVWNHTSPDSPWLPLHPEAGFNLDNSRHLRAAYVVEAAVCQFSRDLARNFLPELGAEITSESHVHDIAEYLRDAVLPSLALWEFFVIHVDNALAEFRTRLLSDSQLPRHDLPGQLSADEELAHIFPPSRHRLGDRFERTADLDVAILLYGRDALTQVRAFLRNRTPDAAAALSEADLHANPALLNLIGQACRRFRDALDRINLPIYHETDALLDAIVENICNTLRYERLDPKGPRKPAVTLAKPLLDPYFTVLPGAYAPSPVPATCQPDEVPADISFQRLVQPIQPWSASHIADSELGTKRVAPHTVEAAVTPSLILANNGWIWAWDPIRDFAGPDSQAYLRRQVIVWGDCVKLRYGSQPSDSPWLWAHMREYAIQTARIFHGIRIDNCHTTPLPVAEYLLDAARQINPDLYVVAELFTGSDATDKVFVNRLGIHSLIREAMSVAAPAELAHFVHMYSGTPVGSLLRLGTVVPLVPTACHALLMDTTHDNPLPSEKRTVYDTLPNSAFVAMACCATGSSRGYDTLLPHAVNVVTETRYYSSWVETTDENPSLDPSAITTLDSGITRAKAILNSLHRSMIPNMFNQTFVDRLTDNVVAITRHCPITHESIVMVAHSAYHSTPSQDRSCNASLLLTGTCSSIIFEAMLLEDHVRPYKPSSEFLNGFHHKLYIRQDLSPKESEFIVLTDTSVAQQEVVQSLSFKSFPAGAVIVLKVIPPVQVQQAADSLRRRLSQDTVDTMLAVRHAADSTITNKHMLKLTKGLARSGSGSNRSLQSLAIDTDVQEVLRSSSPVSEGDAHARGSGGGLKRQTSSGFNLNSPLVRVVFGSSPRLAAQPGMEVLSEEVAGTAHDAELRHLLHHLTLVDLNYILFRCDAEERNDSAGRDGVYHLDSIGDFVYCGLHGLIRILRQVTLHNDLGHPLCDNLRRGNWLPDYCANRLLRPECSPATRGLGRWLQTMFGFLCRLSRHLIPTYFDMIVSYLHGKLLYHSWQLMGPAIGKGSALTRMLCLSSISLFGQMQHSPLLAMRPGLIPSAHSVSLAAGLPHFSSGYMRCWGRDTFIALRGLFLVTQRFAEARELLLGFATTLRHGLIPNLLDSGRNPRYNARDATWWFLQALQDYCSMAPEGTAILAAKVVRIFPYNDQAKCDEYHRTVESNLPPAPAARTEHPHSRLVHNNSNNSNNNNNNNNSQHHHHSPLNTSASASTSPLIVAGRAAGEFEWKPEQGVSSKAVVMSLAEIVQEIMQAHATGIAFREWNAGPRIDDKMRDEGFNVRIALDPVTGFVFGGNANNCGTWMDKMGESARAGNSGQPATPRDGADIEIIGLVKSTVRWLAHLGANGDFAFQGVTVAAGDVQAAATTPSVGAALAQQPTAFVEALRRANLAAARPDDGFLSYKEWNARLQLAFEPYFWVPPLPVMDASYAIDRATVNRRGIYKDTLGATQHFGDYQLRPNQCVAMTVAPELFSPEKAIAALQVIEQTLVGPLGMRTLDPKDWAYRGDYVNSVDSTDHATSRGFNYHQGPEWVWCTGYFLRACMKMTTLSSEDGSDFVAATARPPAPRVHEIHRRTSFPVQRASVVPESSSQDDGHLTALIVEAALARYREALLDSPWLGLTELTNTNGTICADSSPVQAWSAACALDALHDAHVLQSESVARNF